MLNFLTLATTNPVDHVVNQPLHGASGDLFGIHGVWLWSAHVGNLVLAGVVTILVLLFAASKIKTGSEAEGSHRYVTRNPIAHMFEVICVYLRDNTVRPLLHGRTDKFIPFLWTIFFFILFNNLLGLAPISDVLHFIDHYIAKEPHGHVVSGLFGATATQNIFVTAALAILAGIVINVAGIFELGLGGYLKHLTAGTPVYLWPLMIPIEIIGTVIKPVALALRLFANMTAGHILVAVLFMFAVGGMALLAGEYTHVDPETQKTVVGYAPNAGGVVMGGLISVASIVAAIAIYFLELFVAFLQAFVFMFLTTVFISQLSHHGDHEHHEGHDHEHAHA